MEVLVAPSNYRMQVTALTLVFRAMCLGAAPDPTRYTHRGCELSFEIVHTVTDYWDTPRQGVANFRGMPHYYESRFDDALDDYVDYYELSPIDQETFSFALEAWEIWRRWEFAFYQGLAKPEAHPALEQDKSRAEELREILRTRLVVDPKRAIRARATFRQREDSSWRGFRSRPLEVQWETIQSA